MKEVRIGLVLYGGVSLAIYINGVTTELWRLLRASQARTSAGRDEPLSGTEEVFVDLLDTLHSETGCDLRVVIDTVAGTSAGGINGAALTKAIAEGSDFSILENVWINEAGIESLKNEPSVHLSKWVTKALKYGLLPCLGIKKKVKIFFAKIPGISLEWAMDHMWSMFKEKDGNNTLLKGDYFTKMLASTLLDMNGTGHGVPLVPNHSTFDLFLTRTDLSGWPRHLAVDPALHPLPLYESAHAHVMQFQRPPNGGNLNADFELTYAARSTASFPIAFPPVQYTSIAEVFAQTSGGSPAIPSMNDFEKRHLPEHHASNFPADKALMTDGGFLDNKPFSHVIRAIEHKPAEHQIYRSVIYVEPDPSPPPTVPAGIVPGLPEMAGKIFGLFRHEPIFEDLRKLQLRNHLIDDILAIITANGDEWHAAAKRAGDRNNPPLTWQASANDAKEWRQATNIYAATAGLSGYAGYVSLKARNASNVFAEFICASLGYPYEARQAYLIRETVRLFLEHKEALSSPIYVENGHIVSPEQLTLLRAFDIPFRLRRLRALARAATAEYSDTVEEAILPRETIDAFKSKLARTTDTFNEMVSSLTGSDGFLESLLADTGLRETIEQAVKSNTFDPTDILEREGGSLAQIYDVLADRLSSFGQEQNHAIDEALTSLPERGSEGIMHTHITFAFEDITTYPMMKSAAIEELSPIEVMRISPLDVTPPHGKHPKLQGAKLGAFQGFIDRSSRIHDIKWGRIDGAMRALDLIIQAYASDGYDNERLSAIRQEFSQRLFNTIH